MDVQVRMKLANHDSVSVTGRNIEAVRAEIAIIADQDYERVKRLNRPSCEDYRMAATSLIATIIPINGDWSSDYTEDEALKHAKVSTLSRPRMYYFQVLDCPRELTSTFKSKAPQLTTEIHLTTGNEANEFSYEDIG